MFKVVIIGWHYSQNRIPAWVDILRVFQWLNPYTDNIVIITDETERLQHLLTPPLLKTVTSSTSYCEPTTRKVTLYQVLTKQEMLRKLYKERDSRCIFYYTGHGIDNNMVLPSDEIIAWDEVYFLLKCRAKEITMIIDCCSAPSFNLPYNYSKGWKGRECNDSTINVTLFTPKFEKSIVETDGSIFTRDFIATYTEGYDKLTARNVNIQSSTPHPPLFHPTYKYSYKGGKLFVHSRPHY